MDRKFEILLAEDSPSDAMLTREALAACTKNARLHHVVNGVEAIAFVRREGSYEHAPRPDLILLDWKMPRKGGREVLSELKSAPQFRRIPVIVLSTSTADIDVNDAYAHYANCYIAKPLDFAEFIEVMKSVERFWFDTVRMPPAAE